jgi:hypothetical protein
MTSPPRVSSSTAMSSVVVAPGSTTTVRKPLYSSSALTSLADVAEQLPNLASVSFYAKRYSASERKRLARFV